MPEMRRRKIRLVGQKGQQVVVGMVGPRAETSRCEIAANVAFTTREVSTTSATVVRLTRRHALEAPW